MDVLNIHSQRGKRYRNKAANFYIRSLLSKQLKIDKELLTDEMVNEKRKDILRQRLLGAISKLDNQIT